MLLILGSSAGQKVQSQNFDLYNVLQCRAGDLLTITLSEQNAKGLIVSFDFKPYSSSSSNKYQNLFTIMSNLDQAVLFSAEFQFTSRKIVVMWGSRSQTELTTLITSSQSVNLGKLSWSLNLSTYRRMEQSDFRVCSVTISAVRSYHNIRKTLGQWTNYA